MYYILWTTKQEVKRLQLGSRPCRIPARLSLLKHHMNTLRSSLAEEDGAALQGVVARHHVLKVHQRRQLLQGLAVAPDLDGWKG